MSKLAHSHQPTMDLLDIQRAVEEGSEDLLPKHIGVPLLALRAIALAGGKLKGHPCYLTKTEMVKLARNAIPASLSPP